MLALILLFGAQMTLAIRHWSQTSDEGDHILAGYRYWQCGDFGTNPEHPPLLKLVATIPLLISKPEDNLAPCGSTNTGQAEDFTNARQWIFANDADAILFQTRLFSAVFALTLGIAVFFATRGMFGDAAAFLALLLMVFEPNLLAHGALVTTDMVLTCTLFLAVFAFYRYARNPSTGRILLCGLATGLVLAAKHSGILIVPILIALAFVQILLDLRGDPEQGAAPLRSRIFRKLIVGRTKSLAVIFGLAVVVLWTCYGFRFSARPAGSQMSVSLTDFIHRAEQVHNYHSPLVSSAVPALARWKLLPESYLYGLADVFVETGSGRPMFLLGRLYPTGRWFYYPTAFLVKTTLGFLLLLPLILVPSKLLRDHRQEFLYLTVPPVIFLLACLSSKQNIGLRHALPIFPFVIVLAAAAASYLARRGTAWTVLIAVLCTAHVASSVHAFPYYLSYANEAWGGLGNTYRYVADSNVDWGQDYIAVRDWLRDHGISECWFGEDRPVSQEYYGIPCRHLAVTVPIPQVLDGVILVSASNRVGYRWGPGEDNPYAPFSRVAPDEVLAGSMLVYHGRFEVPVMSALSHALAAEKLIHHGRIEEAVNEGRLGASLAPLSWRTHVSFARALGAAGLSAQAKQEYEAAIHLGESQHPGWYDYLLAPIRAELAALAP
jgi:hypothetical protein